MPDNDHHSEVLPVHDADRRTGWMTKHDAELFAVLARGLTTDELDQVARAVTKADQDADRHMSKGWHHNRPELST